MLSFSQLLLLGILLPFSEALSIGSSDILPRSPRGGDGGGGGHGGGHGSSSGGGKGAETGRGSSGDTGHPSISSGASSKRSMNYFSDGGGKRIIIPSGSGSPFVGREIGGGTRSQVAGTRRFGSGYPYYTNNPQYRGVYGNPFPFGFWPVYWPGYGYSDEYGYNHTVATLRPGGELSMVNLVASPAAGWNTTAVNGVQETYWMLGDQQTVSTVLSLLVDAKGSHTYGCGVQNTTLQSFNASDPHLPFHIQNVIQWYRSSSYALAYTGYNNTYASSPLNETTTLDQSTPLPMEQVYSPFLHCINNTLLASLPILDGNPALDIEMIVMGSVLAAIGLGIVAFLVYSRVKQKRYEKLAKTDSEMKIVGE